MEHVVKYTNCSRDDPIILSVDNHESHLSVDMLQYAKDNGVHVITLPPHTSHKTQPLDRSVFGPLKSCYNAEANSWMMRNPGQCITIYQVAGLAGSAWLKAATPTNVIADFKVSGIWPFDRHMFKDEEFLPASVTDRDAPVPQDENSHDETDRAEQTEDLDHRTPIKETDNPTPGTSGFISPVDILGYPKAPERKSTSNRGREKGKSMVATSTPELKRKSTSNRGREKGKSMVATSTPELKRKSTSNRGREKGKSMVATSTPELKRKSTSNRGREKGKSMVATSTPELKRKSTSNRGREKGKSMVATSTPELKRKSTSNRGREKGKSMVATSTPELKRKSTSNRGREKGKSMVATSTPELKRKSTSKSRQREREINGSHFHT
ncbi:uncharacterized protein LOC121373010 [Gigantopelta aegis]|uniref:uncharacterized protein LOC121373010 n=1 Tax=Gigantopelta aegis TaxID=1735272 RepID=UPI001B88A3DF|nr:uncharacterized protein LOC121373010 [Gigantopelta aegis]